MTGRLIVSPLSLTRSRLCLLLYQCHVILFTATLRLLLPATNRYANSVFLFDAVSCRCSHFDILPPKSVLWWMNEWINEWMNIKWMNEWTQRRPNSWPRLPRVGPGHPSSPSSIYFLIFAPLLLFSFFHWLYLFSSFVHPFPFYQNSPTPFQAGGRRRRPNLGLVCVLLCSLCVLTLLVGSFDP